jgi:hypothetical protein
MFKGSPITLQNIYSNTLLQFFIILITLSFALPSSAHKAKDVSLKKYNFLSLPVPNPLDISRLPLGKNYQIKTDRFILQFYFFFQHIRGIIVKRDMKYPIHLRWCFFRSCEEHPLDFISVIAQPHQPPVGDEFFWVRFPPQIKYSFQGLEFTTGR